MAPPHTSVSAGLPIRTLSRRLSTERVEHYLEAVTAGNFGVLK